MDRRRRHSTSMLFITLSLLMLGACAPKPTPATRSADPAALAGPLFDDPATAIHHRQEAEKDPEIRHLYLQVDSSPAFTWFDGVADTEDTRLAKLLRRAREADAVPQIVLYGIPGRDCGLYSSGGQPDEAAYRAWFRRVSQMIGEGPALVVVEPDAINFCSDDRVRAQRLTLLRELGQHFHEHNPSALLYLHTGSGQLDIDEVVTIAKEMDLGSMRGFALNVAAHNTTESQVNYGDRLVAALAEAGIPDRHYVVDTARNGLGTPANPEARYASCNNFGAALGDRPTTTTDSPHADAYLWIRATGGSDGACGKGDPPAGKFYPEITQAVVRNSLREGTVDEVA